MPRQSSGAQGDGGAIVNTASVDGLLPCPGTSYESAKVGAIHFTRSLAVDLAPHGIRINAVSPAMVPVPTLEKMRTGEIDHFWPQNPSESGLMGPLMAQRSAHVSFGRPGRAGRRDEIGAVVLFLARPAGSCVTGQNVAVDGGWILA